MYPFNTASGHYQYHDNTCHDAFLGYIIAAGNMQMGLGQVRAEVDWPQPTSQVQLQHFLGFANFYCRFIRCYSTLSPSLSALTSRKVPFTWSPAADQAFSVLKHRFTTAPIRILSISLWWRSTPRMSEWGSPCPSFLPRTNSCTPELFTPIVLPLLRGTMMWGIKNTSSSRWLWRRGGTGWRGWNTNS